MESPPTKEGLSLGLCPQAGASSPWGLGWQEVWVQSGIVLNPGMMQWSLPALGICLGLSPSLRQGLWWEDGPNSEVGPCVAPPLPRGFVTSDVSKHCFLFFLLFQKQTEKREFLNLWSTQKGEALAEGELGTVPTRRGTHCLR